MALALTTVSGVQIQTTGIPANAVASGALTGTQVATLASAATVPGIPVYFFKDIGNTSTADYDVTLPFAVRVIEIRVVKTGGTGGAADAVVVKSTGNAISNSFDLNTILAGAVVPTLTPSINPTYWEIPAAGVLRIAHTKGVGNAACTVIVTALRIP